MNPSRLTKSEPTQSVGASMSSHASSISTNKNNNTYLVTQSSINATTDLDNSLQSFPMASTRESKRTRLVFQPKGTIPYTIDDKDTIEKVALRFNSTPSELLQLNKLISRTVFPGQVLFVPQESSSDVSEQPQLPPPIETKPAKNNVVSNLLTRPRSSSAGQSLPRSHLLHPSQQNVGPIVWSINRQNSARPGRAHRLKSDTSTESEPSPRIVEEHPPAQQEYNINQEKLFQKSFSVDDNHRLDEDCFQRFIKLHVRLMTDDHRSVAGTLIVTPNAMMFDPDELDPLVKAHGIGKYGLIVRMDHLAGISLYEDLAMYEREASAREEEKRKMCHSISVKSPRHSQNIIPLNTDEEQIRDLMTSLLDQIDKECNPSSTTDTCMLFDASSTFHHHLSGETLPPIPIDENQPDNSSPLSSDCSPPLNEYGHSIGILLDDSNEKIPDSNRTPSEVSYVFDWARFRRAVKVKKAYHLENCVPPDQFKKLFGEIDELLYNQQNYFIPHPIEVPYFLCIRTSMHTHDIPSLHVKKHKRQSELEVDNVYGQKRLDQEYWFAVPKEKIDQLYSFFLRWTPEHEFDPLIDNDPILSKADDQSPKRGFVLLTNDDLEPTNGHKTTPEKQGHYLRRQSSLQKEWVIISADEIYRRIHSSHQNNRHFYDSSITPPKFVHPSTLINLEQSKQILLELPSRFHGLDWYRTFSTDTYGFSLTQLYHRLLKFDHDLPSLLIVKDVEQNVFGAFVPHKLMMSNGFYGTGESFVFTFYPEFRVYNWSGLNEFFVKGDLHSLGFGSGDGTYALWIDGDLNHGRSSCSKTFNNEPLTSHEDFIIASIEVWSFTD